MAKNDKVRKQKIVISKASTNVFADLELPDAEELETKAKLVMKIMMIIKDQQLTQAEAAAKLEIDQPRISDLLNGKLRGFAVYRLMRFVRLLGREINIAINDPDQPSQVEWIAVS